MQGTKSTKSHYSRPVNGAGNNCHKRHKYSPLRRLLNAMSRVLPSRPLASSVDDPISLGKRRYKEAFEHGSQPTAGRLSLGLDFKCRGTSSLLAAHPSTRATPPRIRRPNTTHNSIDPASTGVPDGSSCPPAEPASPAPTEIALDLPLTNKERMEILRAEGIKVRDFVGTQFP